MTMRLNTMKPAAGAKSAPKRVGRGSGSGHGGTAGRGTKGQKSRSGGYHKVGFEGGQMPLQRRLPKRGFRSMTNRHFAEIRLHELAKVEGDVVDIQALQKAGVIGLRITSAKAILSGEISRAVTLRGIGATSGARQAIEKAGGVVESSPNDANKKPASKSTSKPANKSTSKAASSPSATNKTHAASAKKVAAAKPSSTDKLDPSAKSAPSDASDKADNAPPKKAAPKASTAKPSSAKKAAAKKTPTKKPAPKQTKPDTATD